MRNTILAKMKKLDERIAVLVSDKAKLQKLLDVYAEDDVPAFVKSKSNQT